MRSAGRRLAASLCVLTIFITPQVMDSDNLKPAWPMLDPKDHKIIPILPDELDEEH